MIVLLQGTASVSFKSSADSRESGENLIIQASFDLSSFSQEKEDIFFRLLRTIDHHHLTTEYDLSDISQLPAWIKNKLAEQGIFPKKITVKTQTADKIYSLRDKV